MQMQVQMEVADIDACDYCEVKFYSPYKGKMTEPMVGSEGKHYRGWIALIMRDGMLDHYEYSPFGVVGEVWAAGLALADNERVYELIPWTLEEYYLETVPRDHSWWASIMPTVNAFWADVEAARTGTWVAPAANPRKKRKTEGDAQAPTLEIQDESDE